MEVFMKKIFFLIFVFSIYLDNQIIYSQENTAINEDIVVLEKMGLSKGFAKFFAELGLKKNVLDSLKAKNIDLVHELYTGGNLSINGLAALSDCIVVGKIIKKTYDSSEKAFFHTNVYVLVNEYIKGYSNSEEIIVMQISGPYKDGGTAVAGEPQFDINENVLLFLSNLGYNDRLLNLRGKNEQIYNHEIKKGDKNFLLTSNMNGKVIIKDGSLYLHDNYIGSLNDTIFKINKILDLIEKYK